MTGQKRMTSELKTVEKLPKTEVFEEFRHTKALEKCRKKAHWRGPTRGRHHDGPRPPGPRLSAAVTFEIMELRQRNKNQKGC